MASLILKQLAFRGAHIHQSFPQMVWTYDQMWETHGKRAQSHDKGQPRHQPRFVEGRRCVTDYHSQRTGNQVICTADPRHLPAGQVKTTLQRCSVDVVYAVNYKTWDT